MMHRRTLAVFFLSFVFSTIAFLFWQQEYRYSLPTEIPIGYAPKKVYDSVFLPPPLNKSKSAIYFHFYNPDCPCSLFNAAHVRELLKNYGDSIQGIIVVPTIQDLKKASQEFGSHLTIMVDAGQRLATALGVYSTPQAAIVTHNGLLYYRGNYNRARYCTARATNYAELALLSFVNKQPPPVFDLFATQSYGCELKYSNQATKL